MPPADGGGGFCEAKIAPGDIISKFCPPAKENDVDRILPVSLETSKTNLANNKIVFYKMKQKEAK